MNCLVFYFTIRMFSMSTNRNIQAFVRSTFVGRRAMTCAMKVPFPKFALHRMTMSKMIGMICTPVIKFKLNKTVRLPIDHDNNIIQEPICNLREKVLTSLTKRRRSIMPINNSTKPVLVTTEDRLDSL